MKRCQWITRSIAGRSACISSEFWAVESKKGMLAGVGATRAVGEGGFTAGGDSGFASGRLRPRSACAKQQELPLAIDARSEFFQFRLTDERLGGLLAGCHREPHGHCRVVRNSFRTRMILLEIGEVAAEVDEGLVLHERARGRAHMNHLCTGPIPDLPAGSPCAKTPVHILVVDEESLI